MLNNLVDSALRFGQTTGQRSSPLSVSVSVLLSMQTFRTNLALPITSMFAILLGCVFAPQTSHAAISVTGIDRASVVETTEAGGITVYGGVAGLTSRCDVIGSTTQTCNNCILKGDTVPAGDSLLLACNERRIHPTLLLAISFSSDSLDGIPSITTVDGVSELAGIVRVGTTVAKGTATTILVPWSSVCDKIGASSTCVPTGTASGSLRIGISSDGNTQLNASTDDVKDLSFVIRDAPKSSGGTDLADACSNAQSVPQICYFEMGPGDEKAIVKTILAPSDSGFPVVDGSQFRFVRFLFSEQGFNYITLASDRVDLPVSANDTSSFNVSPRRIEGLANDKTYYFKTAVVDAAGNVGLYSKSANDTDCSNAAITTTACRTVTPSQVFGVLDQTNCFIATAAYGTPFASELNTLRDFRDQILSRTSWGTTFTRWYYDHSPKYAAMILESPTARATVRAALVPVVWFAGMTLAYGPLKAGLAFLVSLIIIAACLSLGRRPGVRSAAHGAYNEVKDRARRSLLPILVGALLVPALTAGLTVGGSLALLLSASTAEAASSRKPSARTPAADDSEIQALEDETPPEPEFPYPGAKGGLQSTSPSTDADLDETAPTAPPRHWQQPKAITEDGDYIYDTIAEPPVRQYGKPKLKTFSNLPGREKPASISADGEFQYPVQESEFTGAAGIRFGFMSPPSITNASNDKTFEQIYGKDDLATFMFEYEYPLTRALGRIGIKFELGILAKQAQGRFKNRALTELPEEKFTFLMFPLQAMVHYRFQFADSQLIVPFAEGGAGYYAMTELRDDSKKPLFAGAPAVIAGGGVNILLDWIDRRSVRQLDAEYGINHVWFTAQYRQIVGLKKDLDVSSHLISGGFTFDY